MESKNDIRGEKKRTKNHHNSPDVVINKTPQ